MVFDFIKSKLAKQKPANEDNTGIFKKLKHKIKIFFAADTPINDELFEELEEILLKADLGIEISEQVLSNVRTKSKKQKLNQISQVVNLLKDELLQIITPLEQPLQITTQNPYIILVVGVNGAGKTTTIGKLAHKYSLEGSKVMLAAGDTYRAAAIAQLESWAKRNDVPIVKQDHGADSAAVIFDAIQSAKAKNIDILIADTAGRLHTQGNLMNELSKVVRIIKKNDEQAPHEVMLVIDATIGQNSLLQAAEFAKTIGVTGITITKLDSSAKGGIIFAIGAKLKIPIRFVGFGEHLDDLKPFNAQEFMDAIIDTGLAINGAHPTS